jgi:hypothetical protein
MKSIDGLSGREEQLAIYTIEMEKVDKFNLYCGHCKKTTHKKTSTDHEGDEWYEWCSECGKEYDECHDDTFDYNEPI